MKVSIENNLAVVDDPDIYTLRNDSNTSEGPGGLCLRPNGLRTGQNSGYQALNLAVHAGAARIVLVGYDCKPADDGRAHWFGDHPIATPKSIFSVMLHNFATLPGPLKRLGVDVINCTPGSALKAFPADDLARVLSVEEAAALPA